MKPFNSKASHKAETSSTEKNKFLILRDHRIFIPSVDKDFTVDLSFKTGEEIEVPARFVETLKAEGVI